MFTGLIEQVGEIESVRTSEAGRELNLRGINARVVTPGRVRTGDLVVRLDP